MDHALIKDVISSLLTACNLPFDEITVSEEEDTGVTRIDLKSASASRIIGWHGETLNALQQLAKAILRSKAKLEKAPFILLDVDGYRRDQEEKVCSIAEQKADFVRRTGNRVALSPMSPYFRRIVHLHIANSENLQDLTTQSTGEGEYRQIVLMLKDESKGGSNDQSEELAPVIAEEDGLENLDI